MKISSDSMSETTKKPVRPSHGAWRLSLPCSSSSPSEGEPGGRPKPRKSSEVSVVIEPLRDERQEGQRRHHRVGQQVAEHDGAVGDAERARRVDVFEIAAAQEFGAHHADQRHPGEQQQDAEQHEEAGREAPPR